MDHIHRPEHDAEYDERMRSAIIRTYSAARDAAHGLRSARIHVGSDVEKWMKAQCVRPVDVNSRIAERPASVGSSMTLWGIPVVVEAGWQPDHIVVRIDEVIQ